MYRVRVGAAAKCVGYARADRIATGPRGEDYKRLPGSGEKLGEVSEVLEVEKLGKLATKAGELGSSEIMLLIRLHRYYTATEHIEAQTLLPLPTISLRTSSPRCPWRRHDVELRGTM